MCDIDLTNEENEFTYRNKQFNKCFTPEILDKVCKFNFLSTDIVVSTFPRSGTTFVQEIIWQIKNRKFISKDEQVEATLKRFPFLEFNPKTMQGSNIYPLETLESQRNDPYRLIKTHVPYKLIKDNIEDVNSKMVVVMRNAKDCLVSSFHFHSNLPIYAFKGTFDEFFHQFIIGKSGGGNYFENNLKWWALRTRQNVLILFYENILKNLPENVKKISDFLGDHLTDDEVDKVVHNSSFSTMYQNPNINRRLNEGFTFLRKGVVGNWREYFSEEQNEILNKKLENKFGAFGLKFVDE